MRDMIVSVIAAGLLIVSWQLFFTYSENKIDLFTETIEDLIIPSAEEENWHESQQTLAQLAEDWNRYKKTALIFMDTDSVNDIDYSLAKAAKYLQAHDISNSSGELSLLQHQLIFLKEKEKVNPANIL